jgi:integrase
MLSLADRTLVRRKRVLTIRVIDNFARRFNRILTNAEVTDGTFHDLRKTAITNWFRQGLSEYDVMTLSGHANFNTTHQFCLAVADDLLKRARLVITHQVSKELLEKCSNNKAEMPQNR